MTRFSLKVTDKIAKLEKICIKPLIFELSYFLIKYKVRLKMIFKKLESKKIPIPKGCYSQAVQMGNLIFTSGQLPVDPISGKFISDDVAKQVVRVLENIKNILEDNGSSLSHVIKSTIFISDIKHWTKVNDIYARYFKNSLPPARSIISCNSIHYGLDIEMEVVAYIPPK